MKKLPKTFKKELPNFVTPKTKHVRLVAWYYTPKKNKSIFYKSVLVKGNNKKENRQKALQDLHKYLHKEFHVSEKNDKSREYVKKNYTLGEAYIYSEY